jgi:hypothetical protein
MHPKVRYFSVKPPEKEKNKKKRLPCLFPGWQLVSLSYVIDVLLSCFLQIWRIISLAKRNSTSSPSLVKVCATERRWQLKGSMQIRINTFFFIFFSLTVNIPQEICVVIIFKSNLYTVH